MPNVHEVLFDEGPIMGDSNFRFRDVLLDSWKMNVKPPNCHRHILIHCLWLES